MDRFAIFVDAGYFFAGGGQAAFGGQIPRKQVSIKSHDALLAALHSAASAAASGLPLLRVYWYDAMPGPRLSLEQNGLAMLAGVKLRLGALNAAGEQKGVDSLIVTDLIELARNRAITDAVLVSGDEDLRIAVQVAQSFGVRVHVLAAGDPTRNVSPSLQMEADSVHRLSGEWFAEQLRYIPSAEKVVEKEKPTALPPIPTSPATPSPGPKLSMDDAAAEVAHELLSGLDPEELRRLRDHFATLTSIPPEFDRKLIAKVSRSLSGQRLTGDEMRSIRGIFVRAVRDLAG